MPSSPPPGRAIRLLLADDHRLFAESLMTVLSEDERVEVIGIAANGAEAVALATELEPDVIRKAGLPVQILLLTGTETSVGAEDAAEAGANAFLRKERGVEELRQVFLEVASLAAVLGAPAR